MKNLIRDLAEEYGALDAIVAPLGEETWNAITPFSSWTIRDEISHLAFIDHAAWLSATDPGDFTRHKEDLSKNRDVFEVALDMGRAMATGELLTWWRRERRLLLDVLASLDPKARLEWFGPSMSTRSLATARLMETWAHGQDIVDALGQDRPVTDRLCHIAHIGVMTFGWSFQNRQMQVPIAPIRVELSHPGGPLWIWGPADARESVRGPAEGFCLAVTRRRHVDDAMLEITGDIARQWMLIAQAFAGPPIESPPPGRVRGSGDRAPSVSTP